jgi:DNA segregation ATPase FtsK/SpoIIIE-like protein
MTFPAWSMAKNLWTPQDENSRDAWIAVNAPRVPWETFYSDIFNPEPGEHMLTIGMTGSGKTHLQNELMHRWPFVVAFATKANDSTMDRLITQERYEKFQRWTRVSTHDHPRRVIWPPASNLKTMVEQQKAVFSDAMEHIWAEGGRPKEQPVGWAVAMDEAWWFAQMLNLTQYIRVYLQQGRSNGISLLAASQRPAWVPTELYSQTTHLFFFKITEQKDLDRISEINAPNKGAVKAIVQQLESRQVLYLNNITGAMLRTRAPAPDIV